MKKVSMAILVSLCAGAGSAYAQDQGITTSTDPAKAADVEQRAQDLQNREQSMGTAPAAPAKHHKMAPHHPKKSADTSGT
ncbi:hypothetical protein [Paraburkholderia atlantica]|uniref:hypothetical protein n=1 Tax=Paraburkholderia atlantica TaxID=2654982 RepID=UPI0016074B44|nr:hypothetical protein [Paraburkholderia atlantica]MBB5504244.1 DNA-binding transcriptional regulator of glucitol operon [Paraburkholderia atlantica]